MNTIKMLSLCLLSTLATASGCHYNFESAEDANGAWPDDWQQSGSGPEAQTTCTRDLQCGPSCYCSRATGVCEPSRLCVSTGECDVGFRCDERSTCVPDERDHGSGGAGSAGGIGAGGVTGSHGAGGVTGSHGTGGTRGSGGADATGGTSGNGGAAGHPGCSTCGGTAGPPAAPTCQFNNQCGAGRCIDGTCRPICQNNNDCGTGDICVAGACQPNAQSGGQCVFDAQCGSGRTCINGYCHADCGVDADCPCRHDMCDQGLCKPDNRPVPQCRASADCGSNGMCVNGTCRTTCWQDADCGPGSSGMVCNLGYCMDANEVAPECAANPDCAGGRTCEDAMCR